MVTGGGGSRATGPRIQVTFSRVWRQRCMPGPSIELTEKATGTSWAGRGWGYQWGHSWRMEEGERRERERKGRGREGGEREGGKRERRRKGGRGKREGEKKRWKNFFPLPLFQSQNIQRNSTKKTSYCPIMRLFYRCDREPQCPPTHTSHWSLINSSLRPVFQHVLTTIIIAGRWHPRSLPT